MFILSTKKPKQVHFHLTNKKRPLNTLSALSEMSQSSNKTQKHINLQNSKLYLNQTPLLNFTSFQHYLEQCNQSQFMKQSNEKMYRSQQKCKTQEYFNYQRQKNTSQNKKSTSSNKRNTKFMSIQQSRNFDIEISPFKTTEQTTFWSHNKKAMRNIHSKSESSNYQKESFSFANSLLTQKLGTIQGWSQNQQIKKQKTIGNKNVLKDKKINSNSNNHNNNCRTLKSSQNKIKKEQDSNTSLNRTSIISSSNPFKKPSSKRSFNKENVSQSLPMFKSHHKKVLTETDNNFLFHPFEQQNKHSIKTKNALTQINELQEEILLSRRKDINYTNEKFKQKSQNYNANILMLKRQAEYLCIEDVDHQEMQETKENLPTMQSSNSFNLSDAPNKSSNPFKTFQKFPNYNKKQPANIILDTNETPSKSSNLYQTSQSMLRILQSIHQNGENILSDPKTPIKIVRNKKLTGKQNDIGNEIRSVSKNKEIFHMSIKDRNSQSVFNSISRTGLQSRNRTPKINNDIVNCGQQNKQLTIVNSFHSKENKKGVNKLVKAETKEKPLMKTMNLSVDKEKDLQRVDQQVTLQTQECLGNSNGRFNLSYQGKQISQFQINSHTADFSSQQTISISLNGQESLMLNESSQPLQKLNQLSQEMNKMNKPTPSGLSTKYNKLYTNKKFLHFNKINKKQKNHLFSTSTPKKEENTMLSISITEVKGRQIQQLKKRSQMKEKQNNS